MKRLKGSLLVSITLLLFSLLLCSPVYADENAPVREYFKQQEQQINPTSDMSQLDADSPNFIGLLIKTVFILLIIIALIYGLSRWISKKNHAIISNQFITIKSGIQLGQNKSLRLVKVGSSYYLLGVGNDIQLLKEFTSEAEIEEIEEALQQSNGSIVSSSKKMWNDIRSLFIKEDLPKESHFQSQLEERLMQLRDSSVEQATVHLRDEKQQNRGE